MTEEITPEIGMGATYVIATDHKACTIVDIARKGQILYLQQDKAKMISGGMSEEQSYEYERDPQGKIHKVSRRVLEDGRILWKLVGHRTTSPGCYACLGVRDEYYDYTF